VDLLNQAVEDADLMAARLKFPSDGTSDEAGPAGDENPFGQVNPRLIYVKRSDFGSLAASSSTLLNRRSASLFRDRNRGLARSTRRGTGAPGGLAAARGAAAGSWNRLPFRSVGRQMKDRSTPVSKQA
jgi:hypothetical protein